jgi:hypothetical protein
MSRRVFLITHCSESARNIGPSLPIRLTNS